MQDSSEPYRVEKPTEVQFMKAVYRMSDLAGNVWINKRDIIREFEASKLYANLLTMGYFVETGDHKCFKPTKKFFNDFKTLFDTK